MKRVHSAEVERTDYIVGPLTWMSYPDFKALYFGHRASLDFLRSEISHRSWSIEFNLYGRGEA